MNLYIRIENNAPVDHPILEDNLLLVLPHVDLSNLPSEFARFVRVPAPELQMYEVYEGVTYELVDGVYTDVHHVRPMTEEERIAFDLMVQQAESQ